MKKSKTLLCLIPALILSLLSACEAKRALPASAVVPDSGIYAESTSVSVSDISSGTEQKSTGWEWENGRRRWWNGSGYSHGLTEVDGESYWFDADGFLATGWIETEDGLRFARSDGRLVKGRWEYRGEEYYFDGDYRLCTGWIETENGTLYANESGVLQKSTFVGEDWLGNDGYRIERTFSLSQETLDEVDALLGSLPGNVSLVFEDLVSRERWCWNEEKSYFIASIYKLPYCLWLLDRAEQGEIDLDETIAFTAANHIGEAGIIQYSEYGTLYSIHELIADALIYSDNTALAMLKSVFPPAEFDQWINAEEMGITRPLADSTDTMMNAYDCCTFAEMTFWYMESDGVYADEFSESYLHADDRLIETDYPAGQKYGWWMDALHVSAVVYGERPFAVAICTDWENRTETDEENFQQIYALVEGFFCGE